MKVLNTRKISDRIMQIMQTKQLSSTLNMVVTNGINGNSVYPRNPGALRKEALLTQEKVPEYSVDHLMLLLMVEGIIAPYFSKQPEVMGFCMDWIAAESRVFNVSEFNENPYIKNIDFSNKENGDFELRYMSNAPYELDIYDVPKRIEKLCIDIPRVSCFPETFRFPVIYQKSIRSTWMSVSPNEVYTMRHPIANAHGKVLTLGCGMGYFAYMTSLKKEVESITIIESEQSVIDLFESCILPQFENPSKITVVKSDAVEYLKNTDDGAFDYCFADIWIGVEDVAPYFAVKEIGRCFRKTKMDYWIEDSIVTLLTHDIWIEILKAYYKDANISLPPIDDSLLSDLSKRKERYIQALFDKVIITKPDQIDHYMNPQTVIDLINRTDVLF